MAGKSPLKNYRPSIGKIYFLLFIDYKPIELLVLPVVAKGPVIVIVLHVGVVAVQEAGSLGPRPLHRKHLRNQGVTVTEFSSFLGSGLVSFLKAPSAVETQ